LSTPTVDDQPRGPALTGIADFGKSPPQFDGSTCKIPFVKNPSSPAAIDAWALIERGKPTRDVRQDGCARAGAKG
jgi:hypothetical protein